MPKLTPTVWAQRRQDLIDAGWRCAATTGFQVLTVDDVCAEAGVSKGSFYVYFDGKQDLLLALLEEDAAALDAAMEQLGRANLTGAERLRRFVRTMLERGEDPARVQIRADLWAMAPADERIRAQFGSTVAARRATLGAWTQEAIDSGELIDLPANALGAILLALGDGLMLHAGLDPAGFRWANIRRAVDALLEGVSTG